MEILKAYIGKWVPRTTLHLEEFYRFLTKADSGLALNKNKLKSLREELKIKEVNWKEGIWDTLTAKLDNVDFQYLKDGVVTLGKDVTKLEDDLDYLKYFYNRKIVHTFSYLYSKGAPVPQIYSKIKENFPIILVVENSTDKEIQDLFKQFKDSIAFSIDTQGCHVYGGTDLFVVQGEKLENSRIFRYVVFIHSYNIQLHYFLNLHRLYWDEISLIREKNAVRYKDLPVMRDELINLQKDISFFRSRIIQMRHLAELRFDNIDDEIENLDLQKVFLEKLEDLLATQDYMEVLWQMKNDYCESTLGMVRMLYQENEQKELNSLQIIFIVGVMTSILSLGTLSGARISLMDRAGETVLSGNFASWEVFALLKFGLTAFGISALVYFTVHYIFTSLKQFRIVDITKLRSKTIEGIKQSWKGIYPF